MTEQPDPAQIKANKISLLLILGIPVIGMILTTAYYFYLVNTGTRVETFNSGVLIDPPKQIMDITLYDETGEIYQWQPAKGDHWSFMFVGGADCDENCQQQLYLMRQIRTAMGKYLFRLDTVYLNLDGDFSADTTALFQKEYSHMQLLSSRDPVAAMSWFSKDEPRLNLLADVHFYIVDPRGWVMMYYGKDKDYKQVIRDMKFLLKNN